MKEAAGAVVGAVAVADVGAGAGAAGAAVAVGTAGGNDVDASAFAADGLASDAPDVQPRPLHTTCRETASQQEAYFHTFGDMGLGVGAAGR